MKHLQGIIDLLEKRGKYSDKNYWVPKSWNVFAYEDYATDRSRVGEIKVNPYAFIKKAISFIMDLDRGNTGGELHALKGLVDFNKSVVYSMLPRMFTAWNHYDTKIVSGSFLKGILLLPYLKALNVNIIYLLPVFKYSDVNKKGELGSPYAIKDIYAISPDLHDELLGEESQVEFEFKAFVEACHLLGIRVMVDFVFRTMARDSDWIVDHPDWFYWIHKEFEKDFAPPFIENFKKPKPVNQSNIKDIYESNELGNFLKKFTFSPEKIDSEKWESVLLRHKKTGENILSLIEEEFNMTTVPGFSDVINDEQPPWTDVTYLKIFFDLHETAQAYVQEDQPPYVLYDIAKASVGKGKEPNRELWDLLIDVIPYFQRKFGIDGARIDMGHALPEILNEEMIKKIKAENSDFLLWSEEFNPENSHVPQKSGFQFMTGGLWETYPTIENPGFYQRLTKDLLRAKIPISAALESPDTPRAAWVYEGKESIALMVVINALIPNAVSFINNGFELMEKQPMNLGLGNTIEGRFVLPKEDPMYGRLAFFDAYRLHWTNDENQFMEALLLDLAVIKERYRYFIHVKYFKDIEWLNRNSPILPLLYLNEEGAGIMFLANRTKNDRVEVVVKDYLPQGFDCKRLKLIYQEGEFFDKPFSDQTRFFLTKKAYIILEINH
jgi:starch synthase (maltosyl-transferring)